MTQKISGPGVGLPYPQFLYPSELGGAALDYGSNAIALPAGGIWPVPAGEWWIQLGFYSFLQYLDPITNVWVTGASGAWEGNHTFCVSDGYNARVANMTGCPISAVVVASAGSYVQGSTTITVTGGGGSLWSPIIGGQLATKTWISYGAGYGIAPMALLPPPPPAQSNANGVGGIPATGYFTIASGTVSGFSFTNSGAGYPSSFTIVAVPNPFDPNLSTGITAATLGFSTTLAGSLTGVLCTNSGAPLTNPASITLTVNGLGGGATVTPVMVQTINFVTLTGAGAGFGAAANPGALLTTVGGAPPISGFAGNPNTLRLAHKPRMANIGFSVSGANGSLVAQSGTIYDGGLFYSLPVGVMAPGLQAGTAGSILGPTITFSMGPSPDIILVQPAA